MKIRTAQATTIVLFALVMGAFWGTWFSLSRTMNQLSAETFVAVGHQMIHTTLWSLDHEAGRGGDRNVDCCA